MPDNNRAGRIDMIANQTINLDGDTWAVLSTGAVKINEEGGSLTFCHLASTTRFRQQRNGANPIQICDWVDSDLIRSEAS